MTRSIIDLDEKKIVEMLKRGMDGADLRLVGSTRIPPGVTTVTDYIRELESQGRIALGEDDKLYYVS